MSERFEARYTPDQRAAIAIAYVDRGIRPARAIVELAAAGELTFEGKKLPAFTTNTGTINAFSAKLRRDRAGIGPSRIASLPAREAIEELRRRLVTMADRMLSAEETRAPSKVDPERLRQIARAIREAAAIPAQNEPATVKPGHRNATGGRDSAHTRGGLAGDIMRDALGDDRSPAQSVETPVSETAPNDTPSAPSTSGERERETTSDSGNNGTDVSTVALDVIERG